jgi:starvation-inducible DNA-binding protein
MKKSIVLAMGLVCSLQGFSLLGMMDEEQMVPVQAQEQVVQNFADSANRLNNLLANEYVLYTKTWKFHWNVQGKHFGSLHDFFGKQREQLGGIVDDVAERVRALDVMSDGTLKEFSQKSPLAENPGQNPDDLAMIALLLQDHEAIISQIREDSVVANDMGDYGTNNFLCDLLTKHEKMAWMLRAFLR